MKQLMFALALFALATGAVGAEGTKANAPAKPARSTVDPTEAAEHTKEDVQRHRLMAAAHEAAARCQESGKDEDVCNAELAKACKGIAYGKYCGMKHPE